MDRLYRSRDRAVAGVAAGIGEYLGVDPTIVRVLWAILIVFSGGIMLLVYIIMAFVVPERPRLADVATSSGADGDPLAPDGPGGQALGEGVPPEGGRQPEWGQRRRGGSGVVFGLILVTIGVIFLIREYIPAIDFGRIWPLALIGLGAALLVSSIRRR